jgi:RNA polymerase sigma factor (sigma-70 family)
MARETLETVLQHIRALTDAPGDTRRSDADLLERFIAHGEEAAFATLMRRNGPMVLGVCQRVAGHRQDAEDAFQATFMLLARRADTIRRKESLAAWLYGVAHRVARKARQAVIRRQERERRAIRPVEAPGARAACSELEAELDDALLRLPDKYRTAILLCYFEGRTVDEAARELGCPRGTVASRLAQGRALLRRRLARRGLSLAEGALVTFLLTATSSASVTAGLARTTLQAGTKFAGGAAAHAAAAPRVAVLVAGTLRSMILGKVKTAAILVLIFAGVAAGVNGTIPRDVPEAPQQPPSRSPAVGETSATQPRIDAAGDPLPAAAVARIGTLRFRHPDHVSAVAFGPDGRMLMSQAGSDIRFWDTATGKELGRLANLRYISACDLSPDGKTLAILRAPDGVANHMILGLWDVSTGRLLRTLSAGKILSWVRFSPDGKILMTNGTNSTVQLWDLATGKPRSLKVANGVQPAMFNGDGTLVITTESDESRVGWIRFWNVTTGKETRKLKIGTASVGRIAVSPDDRFLATVGSTWKFEMGKDGAGTASEELDTFIRIWDVAAGKEARRLVTPKNKDDGFWRGPENLLFAPDGKTLFSNGPGRALRAWDVSTGKELRAMPFDCYSAWGLALSRNGKRLATAAGGLTIRLFDAHTGKDLAPPGHNQLSVGRLILSPDGRNLIVQSHKAIEVWDPREARLRRRFEGGWERFTDLRLASDGTALFAAGRGKDVSVWDIEKGARARTIPLGTSKYARQLAVSPDGKQSALATNKSVLLLDTATGAEIKQFPGHEPFVHGLHFTENGKKLLVCSVDHQCHIWDTASGRKVQQFSLARDAIPEHGFPSYSIEISPDQRLIAYGSQSRYLSFRELRTGKELATFADLPDGVCPMVFSPDGRTLAWGGWHDGPVYLMERATGKERRRLVGHKGRIVSLAYSADSKMLVSGGMDTTILVWNLEAPLSAGKPRPLSPAELERCWQKLAGADAGEAYRTIRTLAADPDRAVPFLDKHLSAVPHVTEQHLDRLIAELDSKEFAVREKAVRELESLGELATLRCEKALKSDLPIEVHRRLSRVLAAHKDRWQNPPEELLRSLRAMEALEIAPTSAARKALSRLGQGAPASRITIDAKASLERLRRGQMP